MRKLFYLCLVGILLLSGTVGLAGFNPYELEIDQNVTEGYAPLTVSFYGVVIILIPPQDGLNNKAPSKNGAKTITSSTTPGGNNYVFTWTFGDGTGAKGASVSHVYSNPGRYTITCTCNVGSGIILSKTTTVNVYARTYTVTYNGNGNTSGIVPIDPNLYGQGQTVTVLGNTGNLYKWSYTFAGWSQYPDGSGTTYTPGQTFTMGAQSLTLYAKWKATATNYWEVYNFYLRNYNGAVVSDIEINQANGRIIEAVTTGSNSDPFSNGIFDHDLNGYSSRQLVYYGTTDGRLPWVSAITTDQYGNIYAAGGGFIHKFDMNGSFIRKWSGGANSMAVNKNNSTLFVLDSSGLNNNTVRVYDLNGNLIRQWSATGRSNNIAINNTGTIFLTTLENVGYSKPCVHIYTAYGDYIGGFGMFGHGNGEFDTNLWDIAIDQDGFVYTTESGIFYNNNNRIQKFDSNNAFICKIDLPQYMYSYVKICEYQDKLYITTDGSPSKIKIFAPIW